MGGGTSVRLLTLPGPAPELTRLREHVLRCRPDELPGPSRGMEATLRHFRVEQGPPDVSLQCHAGAGGCARLA